VEKSNAATTIPRCMCVLMGMRWGRDLCQRGRVVGRRTYSRECALGYLPWDGDPNKRRDPDYDGAVGELPVLRSWETAVTSCAGAKGLVNRMLLGTPWDGHSAALPPVI
jgi:hypothetical protein